MSEARNTHPSREGLIPDKLYFRIGEVARLLEVETHTLRFWETEFPQLKVGKGGTGQRLYRRRDVELVFEIKHLLYEEGYTIPGARQFLQNRQRRKIPSVATTAGPPRDPETPAKPKSGLERIRSELRDLSALLNDDDRNEGTRERSRSAAPPQRRGLHLASRQPENGSTPHPLPNLFDPPAE